MSKVVILFNGVGPYGKGEVVDAEKLCSCEEDFKRLVDLQAIRKAEPHEAKEQKVEVVTKADPHASYETRLIEKDRQIADLKVKLAQQEAEIAALKAAVKPPEPAPPPQSAIELIAEKEKQINALKASQGKK